jgi:hypothetical protein
MDKKTHTWPNQNANGVDLSLIRRLLALTPAERFRVAVDEARTLAAFDAKLRRRQ